MLLSAATGLPTYGVFFGWAAASLAGKDKTARIRVLGVCLSVGALCGAAALAAQTALAQILGPEVPAWVCLVAVLAIVNPLMILLGRTSAFGSVPGMFIGFSTLLAIYLGGGGPISTNIVGAFVVAVSMNLTGLGFYWLFGWMTTRPRMSSATEREHIRENHSN